MKNLAKFLFTIIFIYGCQPPEKRLIKISGTAQGTSYHISIFSAGGSDYKSSIDSIFRKIDSSLSTYLPASIISRINRNENRTKPDTHFINVFKKSEEVALKTNGAFDVTVAPLINAWGFGFSGVEKVDSTKIDSLLQYVGFRKVVLNGFDLVKEKPGIMLDFNAIAQGYTVDVVAAFLESKGIKNYLVELGGEVIAKGLKADKENWKVGIDKPVEEPGETRTLQAVLKLENKALATSGNYRKYFEENGQRFSHIIDPKTGYPAKNNLLSASVIADDCMTADAFATAFMVMGLEKSIKFLTENENLDLEVFFIYDEKGGWKTFMTDKLKRWIRVLP